MPTDDDEFPAPFLAIQFAQSAGTPFEDRNDERRWQRDFPRSTFLQQRIVDVGVRVIAFVLG